MTSYLSTAWSLQLSVDHPQGSVMEELILNKEGYHGELRQGLHFAQCPQQLLTEFPVCQAR